MNRAVYTLASGGLAAQARLDAVTQNLANVGTAGYKAGRPIFRLHPLDVSQLGLPEPPELRAAAQVTESETIRDFSQGPVRATGNPLDVAVAGEGFFVVATPRGERYTRQGSFGLDGEGYLVTEHGDRVQGDNGDLRIGTGDVAIGDDGQISVDGISGGRLKLVGFGEHPLGVVDEAALQGLPRLSESLGISGCERKNRELLDSLLARPQFRFGLGLASQIIDRPAIFRAEALLESMRLSFLVDQ